MDRVKVLTLGKNLQVQLRGQTGELSHTKRLWLAAEGKRLDNISVSGNLVLTIDLSVLSQAVDLGYFIHVSQMRPSIGVILPERGAIKYRPAGISLLPKSLLASEDKIDPRIVPLAGLSFDKDSFSPARRPCLFLDRDGIVIKDTSYPIAKDLATPLPEVIPLIKWARSKGYLTVVVSNQSGIARGFFTLRELAVFTRVLASRLRAKSAPVDGWFYCPFHTDATVPHYRSESLLRKPQPGLILKACSRFPIDIKTSIMVGDKESDHIKLDGLASYLIRGRYEIAKNERTFASHERLLAFLKAL